MINKAAVLALVAFLTAGAAHAEGMARVRVIGILPDASSDPVSGVDIEDKFAPDIDLSWFFSKNFAVELLLTVPQTHMVSLNSGDLGEVEHLPPALIAQYHFIPSGKFQPYAGVGINYTFFTKRDIGNSGLKLESGSFGPALQVGFDLPLSDGWYLNADLKKIWIDSDVTNAGGAFVTHVDINPLIVGIGAGLRF